MLLVADDMKWFLKLGNEASLTRINETQNNFQVMAFRWTTKNYKFYIYACICPL